MGHYYNGKKNSWCEKYKFYKKWPKKHKRSILRPARPLNSIEHSSFNHCKKYPTPRISKQLAQTWLACSCKRVYMRTNTDGRDQADDANVGRYLWQVLSCMVVVWRTHRGGSVPRVYTERSGRPWVTLKLCVMRRYNLGGGDLVSTYNPYTSRVFVIYQTMLRWKTCPLVHFIMKPTNSPTRGQPNPEKLG